MTITLGALKKRVDDAIVNNDLASAFACLSHAIEHLPGVLDLHLTVARLARRARHPGAVAAYRQIAGWAAASGHPLWAAVAAAALREEGHDVADILPAVARLYSASSGDSTLYAMPPVPLDPETVLPDVDDVQGADVLDACGRCLSLCASRQAGDTTVHGRPRLPFLSALDDDAVAALLEVGRVHELVPGAVLFSAGDPGNSLFLVARGELLVFTTDEKGAHHEVARLYENTLFGEMAILSEEKRSASVIAGGEGEVIEIGRESLAALAQQRPQISEVLDRFSRERILRNILATHPVFAPFSQEQRASLLGRFEGIEFEAGSSIIEPGQQGQGLYIVLSGRLAVTAERQGTGAHLADLATGDVFGEMALLSQQNTSASVQAVGAATLLFLARDPFVALVGAAPELATYFQGLAESRREHNQWMVRRH